MSRPILDALAGIALLSVMDATVKSLVGTVPVIEVAFLRYLVGSVAMLALTLVRRPGWPRADTVRANAVRAVAVIVTAVTFFYGLGQLPLAETLVLTFLSPLATALLAASLLGERIHRQVGIALLVGFGGVIVIVAGNHALADGDATGGGERVLGIVAVLVSTVSYSTSMVLLRARASRDPLLHIVLIQNVVPALVLAVPTVLVFRAPAGSEWAKLLAVGLLGVGGHLMLARAYAAAAAARLAAVDYTALLWAILIGFGVYGEVPGLATLCGGALIVAATVAIGRR